MDLFDVLSLLGGLAMFLFGMTYLSGGLEKLSGGRMEKTLEKLTNNIFLSIMLGALVTATIQSSSATTVIVVGLVNARMLKLRQAIGVIMGANIGTTVTAHLLRLSSITTDNLILQMFKPKSFAPVILCIGLILLFSKKNSKKTVGQILVGFGILFLGMLGMESAVSPLRGMPEVGQAFATLTNPVLGVLVGALVTAAIQSSSASVGILQALATTGQITFAAAFPIIMGQNIGTCVTPVLAGIGASKNAKRAAMIHLSFNIIGTLIFLIGTYAIYYLAGFPFWNDAITMGGIANFHTLFNVSITLLLIPFAGLLEKLACFIIKDKKGETEEIDVDLSLDDRLMTSPGLAVRHAHQAVLTLAQYAKDNYERSWRLIREFDPKRVDRINELETTIDKLEDRINLYLLNLTEKELSDYESKMISQLLRAVTEFERIGDHAVNIMKSAVRLHENAKSFSKQAESELENIFSAVDEIMALTIEAFSGDNVEIAKSIEPLEQIIDLLDEQLKDKHVERLTNGQCTLEAAFPFMEILHSLERISDHCSNVGIHIIVDASEGGDIDSHVYLQTMHKGGDQQYAQSYAEYEQKYFSRV